MRIFSIIFILIFLFINCLCVKTNQFDHFSKNMLPTNQTYRNNFYNDTLEFESFDKLPVSMKLNSENIQYLNVGVLMASDLGKKEK